MSGQGCTFLDRILEQFAVQGIVDFAGHSSSSTPARIHKSAMAEDDSWVFDSLVCFLNGPVWNAPLQSFIEERSLIFEPDDSDHDEYRQAFEDFKNLVDFMLGNFMEDIGISPQQFEQACFKGARDGVPLNFDQNTFEQIWAANDYTMFKKMMAHRNVELQLQALELIERKFGRTPDSFIPKKKSEDESSEPSKTMVEIVPIPMEQEILVEVSKQFTPDEKEECEEEEEELKYILEEKTNLEETLKKTKEEKLSTQRHILEQTEAEVEEPHGEVAPEEPQQSKAARIPIDRPQKTEVDNVELKKRQEYLRAQRDKLVALKKEARKKHLGDDSDNKARARPKSARAAESLLAGNSSTVEPDNMKLRKALVERLKSEVVNKN